MAVRIVRLGTPRKKNEGLRIGTVRRPPRGVAKTDFARKDWYDVWYPELSPTPDTMKMGLVAQTDAEWKAFVRRFRKEMSVSDRARTIALLARLSHQTDFSVGCYCEDENRCHRSVLRQLLEAEGAKFA